MFLESCPPLPWDKENNYTREAVEIYYEVNHLMLLLLEGALLAYTNDSSSPFVSMRLLVEIFLHMLYWWT